MRFSLSIAMAVLLIRSCGAAPAAKIAVYQSEKNAATYHGVYEEPLRSWLQQRGEQFDVIGDKVAADPARLKPYTVVLASSSYLVPDAAAAGLARYVFEGGRLIWFDSPARCNDHALRAALGLAPGASYTVLRGSTVRATDERHPAAMSVTETKLDAVTGNFATTMTAGGRILYELTGKTAAGAAARYPAVILSHYGSGVTLCYNWIVWLNNEPEVSRIIADGLDWMLAGDALSRQPLFIAVTPARANVRQPAPVEATCKIFTRASAAALPTACDGRLVGANAKPVGATERASLHWDHTDGIIKAAAAELRFTSGGLADGKYRVVAGVGSGAGRIEGDSGITLDGQQFARLLEQQKQRRKMLAPLIDGTLGDYDAEPRTQEGRVDIPRLMQQIQTAHMNMYDFLIWHAKTDWDDFQTFLPVARKAGIKVWITLCPPSEQGGQWPWSEPYRLDFVHWADAIGKLSQKYDNLVGWVIDDFWSGANRQLFTPEYIGKVVDTLHARNPRVAFLPTIYWWTIGDQRWIEDYGPEIDGIVFPYAELATGDALAEQLKTCRAWIGPDKFLLINVYASGSSGSGEKGPRSAAYMRKVLTTSREMCDGIRIYCLPKDKLLNDYRYAITAELYGKWEQEERKGEEH